MSNIFVKPRADENGNPVLVRDPFSRVPLAAEGEWKPRSTFWTRRLRDGDVVEAETPTDASSSAVRDATAEKPRKRTTAES